MEPDSTAESSATGQSGGTGQPGGTVQPTGAAQRTDPAQPADHAPQPGRATSGTGATPADIPARRPVDPDPDHDRDGDRAGSAAPTGAIAGGDRAAGGGHGGYGEYESSAGPRRRDPAERGLRGLVAAGPSQVGVTGAMRARDAARPRPEDVEAAERELTIVRRYYVPPEGSTPTNPAPDPD